MEGVAVSVPRVAFSNHLSTVVRKAIVRGDGILELHIDLDPGNPRKEEPTESISTPALPLAVGADSVECKSWGLGGNGGH